MMDLSASNPAWHITLLRYPSLFYYCLSKKSGLFVYSEYTLKIEHAFVGHIDLSNFTFDLEYVSQFRSNIVFIYMLHFIKMHDIYPLRPDITYECTECPI